MRLRPAFPVVLLLVVFAIGLFALASQAFQFGGMARYDDSPVTDPRKGGILLVAPAIHLARAALGRVRLRLWIRELVARLPQGRPPVSAGHEAPHAQSRPFDRAGRRPRSRPIAAQRHRQYPWVYAVQVQNWTFTDAEAKRLRELSAEGRLPDGRRFPRHRGLGEVSCDGMRMVFPDRPIEDLDNNDEIFHVLYDSTTASRCPASNTSTPAAPMRRTATSRSGAPFATTRAASWWPFATTCIWATPGNGPTCPNIRSDSLPWLFGLARLHHVWNDALTGGARRPRSGLAVVLNMFEFLFKYPVSIFSKGEFVLLGAWPKWVLVLLVLAAAAGLGAADSLALAASRCARFETGARA